VPLALPPLCRWRVGELRGISEEQAQNLINSVVH